MKAKFLLFGAAVALGFGFAQARTVEGNLLVNGDFEDLNFGTTYEEFGFKMQQIIPGWDLKKVEGTTEDIEIADNPWNMAGNNQWNAFGFLADVSEEMLEADADANNVLDPDSYYFLRYSRCPWNGWFEGNGLTQTVSVTPGETYDISFVYAASTGETRSGTGVKRFVKVYEAADGVIIEGSSPIFEDTFPNEETPWTYYEHKGIRTDAASQLTICVGLDGNGWEQGSGENRNVFFDVDDVIFVSGNTESVEAFEMNVGTVYALNGEIIVAGAELGLPVSVYTVNGLNVANTVVKSGKEVINVNGLKGAYIVRVGKKARKVVL